MGRSDGLDEIARRAYERLEDVCNDMAELERMMLDRAEATVTRSPGLRDIVDAEIANHRNHTIQIALVRWHLGNLLAIERGAGVLVFPEAPSRKH